MAESDRPVLQPQSHDPSSNPLATSLSAITRKAVVEDFVRPPKRPRLEEPPPMTAAIAFADARQRSKSPLPTTVNTNKTSPNPANEAISALMGVSQNAINKAYTSTTRHSLPNPATTLSEGMALAAEHMNRTGAEGDVAPNDTNAQTSPASMSSLDTQETIAAPSGITTTVASPMPVDTKTLQPSTPAASGMMTPDGEQGGSRSYPFPGPLLQPHTGDGRRGMSLPHSGLRHNTRSPSSKKHKCPYCGTEFTRHHNLKSHLLTHSQEKPFVCSTCQSRFRRLHDLKRHTKLHTGERPHVCPKCNRKFARGDALARHNKGPGGCAGRRASVGSFGASDEYEGGDDTMDGVMYGEPESMEDADGDTARGTPSIRRQAPSGDDNMDDTENHSRIPSTYPPIQGRPPGGIASGSFPPRAYGPAVPMGSSGPPPPTLYPSSGSSSRLGPSNAGSIFAQNSITESPKPISPSQPHRGSGATDSRLQSPSMPHFQQPQHYARTMSGSGPGMVSQSTGPQLPPPHGLNPPDSRYTLPSQGAPTHPPTQPSGPPTHMGGSGPLSSHSNSLSSHGQSGHGSGENASSMFNKDERIWAYVKDLEKRMNSMQDEISTLKSQLAATVASQQTRL